MLHYSWKLGYHLEWYKTGEAEFICNSKWKVANPSIHILMGFFLSLKLSGNNVLWEEGKDESMFLNCSWELKQENSSHILSPKLQVLAIHDSSNLQGIKTRILTCLITLNSLFLSWAEMESSSERRDKHLPSPAVVPWCLKQFYWA